MQTLFITANDTDVGKTYLVGVLANHFAAQGRRVQVVKAMDCGASGDATWATEFANSPLVSAHTLFSYPAPLAPMAAQQVTSAPKRPQLQDLVATLDRLPTVDVRIVEGAGGVAVPIDTDDHDWLDFVKAIDPDITIAVVENRLGAINQTRLLHAYLGEIPHVFVLNELKPCDDAVKQSNHASLAHFEFKQLGRLSPNARTLDAFNVELLATNPVTSKANHKETNAFEARLAQRKATHAFRTLSTPELPARPDNADRILNLADNDYLGLRQHPAVCAAAKSAIDTFGCSASASPLITGYTQAHQSLEQTVSRWYGKRPALIWNSGYAANQSILKLFVHKDDLVIADRLIHHSLISGILQSGARLLRFPHNALDRLEQLLQQFKGRTIHVVTESLYSMDGDSPDLAQLAQLKARYGFTWYLDEAHALGWYGNTGAGLAEAAGVIDSVDVLIGTMGKALAASGAFTVFRQSWMRDLCINEAGEFIYSTYLPPASAAAAQAAIELIQQMTTQRSAWQNQAQTLRRQLRHAGWQVLGNDSPIIPVVCGQSERALRIAADFLQAGIQVAAIRPPTVAKGAARLRLSLRSQMTANHYQQILDCFHHNHTTHA